VGDKVLLYDETVRRGRSKKLSSQWLGPYEVISLDRVNAIIKAQTKGPPKQIKTLLLLKVVEKIAYLRNDLRLQMDPGLVWIIPLWIAYVSVTPEARNLGEGRGYSIDRYDESPGLYYELLGETVLYNSEWKTIVYVNLKETDSQTEQLDQYISHVNKLCTLNEIQNWTDCNHFSPLSRDRFRQLQETENILNEIIGKPEKPGRDEVL
jgi:hypothetical protein